VPTSIRLPWRRIAREWVVLGFTGFGGPPAHVNLLRRLTTQRNEWLTDEEFNDALATTNLLPGPGSTQLAMYCAWRLGGVVGAIIGAAGFIVPGLVAIIALSMVFFAHHPANWILGAGAGAAAVVPAIAILNAWNLVGPTRERLPTMWRWWTYLFIGVVVTVIAPAFLVIALLGCGIVELGIEARGAWSVTALTIKFAVPTALALSWVAFKVGALSYGGGFVIIPLMQHDVVTLHHWMTGSQFANAVALGQATPGPVVLTVAAVGYAAGGLGAALLATAVAFTPSLLFVMVGGRHFRALRRRPSASRFLAGAGVCVTGAIGASAVPLSQTFVHPWQWVIAVLALGVVFVRRLSVVALMGGAALVGSLLTLWH
jgi:chromate transporter